LIGLNLMQGFRHELKQRLAGVAGCTHLTELAQILPTAAVQAFAGDVWARDGANAARPGSNRFNSINATRCAPMVRRWHSITRAG
jgi:hypothetical protein